MEDEQSAPSAEEGPLGTPSQKILSLSMPPETNDLRDFIRGFPDSSTKARNYDKIARSSHKEKYTAFSQGSAAVITRRTADIPVANHQAGM